MTCSGCNREKNIFSLIGGIVPSKPAPRPEEQKQLYSMHDIIMQYLNNDNDRRNKGSTD